MRQRIVLIRQAKSKYPEGTKFISPYSGKQYTSKGIFNVPNYPYHHDVEALVEESSCAVHVYLDKQWAEIIKT